MRGIALDPENHPVAGARVTISGIWAMGDWLGTGTFRGKSVFTDEAGRFTFCVPVGPDKFTPCSGPVPPNSRFLVAVILPDFSLFPDVDVYGNSEEAVIHLARPERFHRFVFLGPDGQPLPRLTPEQWLRLHVTRERLKMSARLPASYAFERVKLAPGRVLGRLLEVKRRKRYQVPRDRSDTGQPRGTDFPVPAGGARTSDASWTA